MTPEVIEKYSSITKRCFINAPFDHLEQGLLELFIQHRLQPEIGLEGNCLWEKEDKDFADIGEKFHQYNIECTLHAPFFDLSPGAIDQKIREVSRQKLRRAFELTMIFKPKSIVCHLGYDEDKHSYKLKDWLQISVETWNELLEIATASGTPVMFENTYEQLPDVHLQLFEQLSVSNFGFCLDVGHLMAYAGSTWQVWLDKLQPWLGQVHLHDNDGHRDDHMAIGDGKFDFLELFQHLHLNKLSPLITLEPHSEKDLWASLESIHALGLFSNQTE